MLSKTLQSLTRQTTEQRFSYSVAVADNDVEESARAAVEELRPGSPIAIEYTVEPEQNIAKARNRALSCARGEYLAFIDDDEIAPHDWLLQLLSACERMGADGVLGPVLPRFEVDPPAWVTKGRFFDRKDHPTGYELRWTEGRTGNVLFRSRVLGLLGQEEPFRTQFATAGEDMDFFRRVMDRGAVFKWCAEAPVHEWVPPSRCKKEFLLKRALLRGANFPKHPADRLKNVLKSILAVPAYALVLPVAAALGEHQSLKYTIKLLEHGSRLLAFSGIRLAKAREM